MGQLARAFNCLLQRLGDALQKLMLDRPRPNVEYRDAMLIIQEQTTRLTRMPLYLEELVAECVNAAGVLAAREHIALVAQLAPDTLVDADDGLLRQLVTNLIDNAIRYTPPHGGVTVKVCQDNGFATIAVADTGPGIPVADRERVFERFVRLDPARSSTSGAGLGLPIARWIAEQHGGTLTLQQNAVGQTVFVASLPLKAAAVFTRTGEDSPTART